jgi:predicted GIY-YIG superfamily endonuclease
MPESPERTALYRLFDSAGALLYVGITGNPENRLRAHRKDKEWWPEVDGISIEWFESRHKASQAETQAIATESARHNVHQTDAWRVQQRDRALRVSPEKRRNRSVGLKARTVQVHTYKRLLGDGVPDAEARRQAQEAREEYLEAHRLP